MKSVGTMKDVYFCWMDGLYRKVIPELGWGKKQDFANLCLTNATYFYSSGKNVRLRGYSLDSRHKSPLPLCILLDIKQTDMSIENHKEEVRRTG